MLPISNSNGYINRRIDALLWSLVDHHFLLFFYDTEKIFPPIAVTGTYTWIFDLSFSSQKRMRRETQEFKENKQLSIDMHCSHVRAHICYYSWLHHRLFINWLKTVNFVFFSFTVHLFYSMSICSIRGRFFFTVHSSYKYVQLNQRNTLEHKNKKSFQQEQTFFLQCSSLFFHESVSSPLNKESMDAPCARTTACVQWLFAVCVCYCVNNA